MGLDAELEMVNRCASDYLMPADRPKKIIISGE
jgi:hypothetical protein